MARKRRRTQKLWQQQYAMSGRMGIIIVLLVAIGGLVTLRFVDPNLLRTQVSTEGSGQCYYSRCIYLGLGSECTLPSIEVSCDYAACNSGPCTNTQITPVAATPPPSNLQADITPLPLVTTIPASNLAPALPISGNAGEPEAATPTPIREQSGGEEPTQAKVTVTPTPEPGPDSLSVGGQQGKPITFFVWLQKLQDAFSQAIGRLADFFRSWRGVASQRD